MGFATLSKIIALVIWPLIFILIMYFKDREKFKKKWKSFFENN